jgi:hypothetical protein
MAGLCPGHPRLSLRHRKSVHARDGHDDAPGAKIVPAHEIRLIFRVLKLLAFLPLMFRRKPGDETNLPVTKPFSAFRADIPKRSLTNNSPNEPPPSGELGVSHVERHRYQRRSQGEHRRCARDIR